MAFIPYKLVDEQDVKRSVYANSQLATIGVVVIPAATTHAAAVTPAATSGIVLGVVRAIIANGKPLEAQSNTVASNNETVAQTLVEWIPAYIPIEYTADMSAAGGTTTSSDLMQAFNLASGALTIDESSTGVFSTQKQFFSFGTIVTGGKQLRGKFATTAVC